MALLVALTACCKLPIDAGLTCSPCLAQAELAVFFQYLAELGYAVVSREDNPLSLPGTGCCSEFTLIRVEQPAGCG